MLSNVGIDVLGPFEELDLPEAPNYPKINVIGTAVVFQAFLSSMRENRSGELIAHCLR